MGEVAQYDRASSRLARVATHISAAPSRATKLCTADEAAALVHDDDRITFSSFVGAGCPEELLNAIGRRYRTTRHPSGLRILVPILAGDGKGRGADVLAQEGLVDELVYAWGGTSPKITQMVFQNKIKTWNLPYGCVSQMIRDCAAGRRGPLTKIGIGTFVDPREKGGRRNASAKEERVKAVEFQGERLLWYPAPAKIHVALLRGTTADVEGNISFEREPLLLDNLLKAVAVHNSGGVVIVQVERLAERGAIPTRSVHIPGALVDKVVVASSPRWHQQTLFSEVYDPSLSGEWKVPLDHEAQFGLNERKIIAHRAFFEITKPSSIVNLGVGMPEGVAVMTGRYAGQNPAAHSAVLTTEAGVMGGYPCGGIRFGTAQNPTSHLTSDTILDLYNGGGVDIAFLGMAEVDEMGNVNVSDFGNGRMPGCGGFIDISQSAKSVVFMGCQTSNGLRVRHLAVLYDTSVGVGQVRVEDGQLRVLQEGRLKKFRKRVKEKTFAAVSGRGRKILYVTERAVFRLLPEGGLELTELAPGVALEEVLATMEFRPRIKTPVETMHPQIFAL